MKQSHAGKYPRLKTTSCCDDSCFRPFYSTRSVVKIVAMSAGLSRPVLIGTTNPRDAVANSAPRQTSRPIWMPTRRGPLRSRRRRTG